MRACTGVLGVQLFKGSLLYRCHPHNASFTVDGEEADVCAPPTVGDAAGVARRGGCDESSSCVYYGENPVSSNSVRRYVRCTAWPDLTMHERPQLNALEATAPQAAPLIYMRRHPNACQVHGTVSFDSIGWAWITLFQCVTMEGWVDVMYMEMATTSSLVSIVYFVSLVLPGSMGTTGLSWRCHSLLPRPLPRETAGRGCSTHSGGAPQPLRPHVGVGVPRRPRGYTAIVNPSSPPAQLTPACANAARVFCALRLGSFYLLNLFLAVLYDEYTEGEAREKESKAAALDTGVLELEQSEALLQTEEQLLLAATDELEELGKLEAAPRDCGSGLLLGLVEHAYFSHLIMLLIVVNTGLMMCEHYGMSAALLHFLEQANVVLTACFTGEMLLKMAAYGCRKYFDDPFSRFDAVVVFASLLELLLDYTKVDVGINPSFLRAFRLMRAFKLARSWKGLQKIMACVPQHGKTRRPPQRQAWPPIARGALPLGVRRPSRLPI